MSQPLILHAHSSGPNPIKIAMALEFLEVPYTVKTWEFGSDPKKGVKGATYLKINENGRVPALEDPNTGVVSWESGAVMNYVLRVYDKSGKLGPNDHSEQSRVDWEKWQYFLLTTLGPMTGQVNWYRYYNAQKNEDALQRYVDQTMRCYELLESQLKKSEGKTILGGDRVTAVDFHFEPWVREYSFAKLSLDEFPRVREWLNWMGERTEVRDAHKRVTGEAVTSA
ncbi:MAG: hypothetical protein Q9227_005503 [Pyrenula ochraceoflavens]